MNGAHASHQAVHVTVVERRLVQARAGCRSGDVDLTVEVGHLEVRDTKDRVRVTLLGQRPGERGAELIYIDGVTSLGSGCCLPVDRRVGDDGVAVEHVGDVAVGLNRVDHLRRAVVVVGVRKADGPHLTNHVALQCDGAGLGATADEVGPKADTIDAKREA